MRRWLSILLVLFFVLGPLTSTLQASDEVRLPPCCRRNGAHHCAMSDALMARMAHATGDPRPAFTTPSHCPYYPGSLHAAVRLDQAMVASGSYALCGPARTRILISGSQSVQLHMLQAHAGRSPPSPAFD